MIRRAILKKMMKTNEIWLLFSCVFIFFLWALFRDFYENHNGNRQYDVFINCPHYSAFDKCAWCLGSHNSLVGFDRHLYPTPTYIVKGRNNRILNPQDLQGTVIFLTKMSFGEKKKAVLITITYYVLRSACDLLFHYENIFTVYSIAK